MTTREELDEICRKHEDAYLQHLYDVAYYKSIFCSENERPEASRELRILRHKYFNM